MVVKVLRPTRGRPLAEQEPHDGSGTYTGCVSDAAAHRATVAKGVELLPADLTNDQLENALVMASPDVLLINDLSDDEDRAFAAALDA